jgi:3-deoxy-D-manno-octulosonate cytidylyltransferase
MGKPMLQHVWERAKSSRILDDLIIACDDELIQKAASEFGAKTVMTSREHACGTDRISEVVNPLDVKVVVNIQGDEPLVHPLMIDSVARALLQDSSLSMATIMKRIENPAEITDPHVVKVVTGKNDLALYFSRSPFRTWRLTPMSKRRFITSISVFTRIRKIFFLLTRTFRSPHWRRRKSLSSCVSWPRASRSR